MKIGVVSIWLNRGQSSVQLQILDMLRSLGHEIHLFVRPPLDSFRRKNEAIARSPELPTLSSVTYGFSYEPIQGEYVKWVQRNQIESVFFDQNYAFNEISRLKLMGVKTIGRFVWESFDHRDAAPANNSFNTIYGLTHAECQRYQGMGLSPKYVRWSISHRVRSLRLPYNPEGPLVFMGGWMSARKPLGAVLKAWSNNPSGEKELIIKSQRPLRDSDLMIPLSMEELKYIRKTHTRPVDIEWLEKHHNVRVIDSDLDNSEYISLLSSASVLVCPARWEGLGLHFFEAMALGIPVISSSIAPITEFVADNETGLTTASKVIGKKANGLSVFEPSVRELEQAFLKASNSDYLSELSEKTLERASDYSEDKTALDLNAILQETT